MAIARKAEISTVLRKEWRNWPVIEASYQRQSAIDGIDEVSYEEEENEIWRKKRENLSKKKWRNVKKSSIEEWNEERQKYIQ